MKNFKAILFVFMLSMLLAACQNDASPTATAVPATTTKEEAAADVEVVPTDTAVPAAETEEPTETSSGELPVLPLVDTFEGYELQSGTADFASIGYITWSDGSPISIETVVVEPGDPQALPDQTATNTVLQLNTDVGSGGWAGFSNAFANAAGDTWLTQDWSAYEGVALWLYGNNSGGTIFMDILDNRAAGSNADDAGRWTVEIPDDFTGWQYFEIPFDDFRRKDIGNGAPNDGFTYDQIHGYAVGVLGTVDNMGPEPIFVDDVQVYGVAPERPVEIRFFKTEYLPREGGRVTVNLVLNKPSETPITVEFTAVQGNATLGEDFILPEGVITFAPGETGQSLEIEVPDDTIAEGTENTVLVLKNPSEGAVLNPQSRAILSIRDDEPVDEMLIDDFNTPPPFLTTADVTVSLVEVDADGELALPEQANPESVLQISGEGAESGADLRRVFASGQDWSAAQGVSFWFYGTGSGAPVTVELLSNGSNNTAVTPPEEWQMIWSDEFDTPAGTPPNPAIWQPEIGDGFLNGIPGWGNGELEYYTDNPENVATDGEGNLVITAVQLDPATSDLQCWYGACEYTSARLITWGNVEFEYGRVEARLKLPFGQGMWPAFWMLGTDLAEVSWPQSGEIDIMENIGREPSTTHGTIHGPGYSGGEGIGAPYELAEGTVADDFHVYAIEWTPDQIRWFVDDEEFLTLTPDDIPAGSEWVYNHPFFIIMNVAVGGNWPGLPDETTTFPQTMHVDYVRVYGAPDTAERFSVTFTDDTAGWQQITLPFADFVRSADQPAGASEEGLNLQDIWGYTFRLPANNYYMDKLSFE